eukprot:TRINITY_DN7427_c0_g1_i1.p1 TRINITY_DN7427_c0_g1~~TRINITY_DN7427_c0_g1_i1.p1  ORF type:complete len:488 (-),score=107.04 TRINITY_DN7427_c0_g1_i1:108-1571(-)
MCIRDSINAEYGGFNPCTMARLALCALLTVSALGKMMDNYDRNLMGTLSDEYPAPRYVLQPQDHFDASNKRTWLQAYYVNDTFFTKGSDAPVFLCVGGEGPPIDGSAVVSSVHCNVAVEWLAETKALMIAVEHRYYGCHNMSACPYSAQDQDPLKFLSSRQAVEDLANAHSHITTEYGLSAQNKWVSWGGSYPGMMASFVRIKHPELIHASVASSAPVIAQLDMPEYNNIAAEAYGLPSVGGSPACTAAIAKGHAVIGDMMKDEAGRDTLQKQFGVSATSLLSRAGQASFAGNGVTYFPSQGNDPACTTPGCNIEQICKVMVDMTIGSEVDRLAKLKSLQSTDVLSGSNELDYWGYQTCNEFGFYQTCEVGSKCFYTQGLVLLKDMDGFCTSQFKISAADVAKNIEDTNTFYGADHPKATRIFYPNGDVDPWHGLSKLTAGPELPVLMVSGASHHAWTHPSAPTDQQSVIDARQKIRVQVAAWLAEA